MYDPSLGRFMGLDLLSDKYSFQSPYVYAMNNPIRFIDYLGMGPDEPSRYSQTTVNTYQYNKESNTHTLTESTTSRIVETNKEGKEVMISHTTTTTATMTPVVRDDGTIDFQENISQTTSTSQVEVKARHTTMDGDGDKQWVAVGEERRNLNGDDGTRSLSNLGNEGNLTYMRDATINLKNYVSTNGVNSSPFDISANTGGLGEINTWLGIGTGIAGNITNNTLIKSLSNLGLGVSIGAEINKVLWDEGYRVTRVRTKKF
jgi:hypothetical protein